MPSIFIEKYLKTLEADLISADKECLSYSFPQFSLSDVLNYVSSEKIFYYSSKEEEIEFLGLGLVKNISDKNILDRNQFYSFSMNFEDTSDDLFLNLHEWTFVSFKGRTSLIIHRFNNSFSPVGLIFHPLSFSSEIPRWKSYDETPDHVEWELMINKAKASFQKQELDKIILHRKKIFDFNDPIDPINLFERLLKHNPNSAFKIYHQKTFDNAFISFTPEKLFSIHENLLTTYAIAGSIPRGRNPDEETLNENYLKNNSKLIKEHQIVVDEIKNQLHFFSTDLELGKLEILKLAYIMHRSIKFTAKLKKQINFSTIVSSLHPTPAIGGHPKNIAIQKIKEIENENRNEYAAPIGIHSLELSSVAVGIRSALLKSSKLSIFGGCGIIMESNPEDEWIETGIKMKPFIEVITQ